MRLERATQSALPPNIALRRFGRSLTQFALKGSKCESEGPQRLNGKVC